MRRILLTLLGFLFFTTYHVAFADSGNTYEFYGTIEQLPPNGLIGDWIVSGTTVHVTSMTTIDQEHGNVEVGAFVHVEGYPRADGSIEATEISVEYNGGGGDDGNDMHIEWYGMIESMPTTGLLGTWVVGGRTIYVDTTTTIDQEHGLAQVGAFVKVEGIEQADGSIVATSIEVDERDGDGQPGDDFKFYGFVEQMPPNGYIGDWSIAGYVVHVSATTQIDQEHGAIAPGTYVKVEGRLQADGTVDAQKIESQSTGNDDHDNGYATEFRGLIEQLPANGIIGDWRVSGITVTVSISTTIDQSHGNVAVGALVDVKGVQQPNGAILATEISVEQGPNTNGAYVEMKGTVENLPPNGLLGEWRVDGYTVHVTTTTRIDQEHGPIVMGSIVEVKGYQRDDGSIDAVEIDVQEQPGDDNGANVFTKFYGTVEQMPTGTLYGEWRIGGRTVHITTTTTLEQDHGPLEVGAYVQVEGFEQADGSLNATKVETKAIEDHDGDNQVELRGTVEQLPVGTLIGEWVVSGQVVHVLSSTTIEQQHGAATVGAYVEVKGTRNQDGSIVATKIDVRNGGTQDDGDYVKFNGAIEQMPAAAGPGTWTIAGRTVIVDANTILDTSHGAFSVGTLVEVKGMQQADGSVVAIKIEVKENNTTTNQGNNTPGDPKQNGGQGDIQPTHPVIQPVAPQPAPQPITPADDHKGMANPLPQPVQPEGKHQEHNTFITIGSAGK